MRKKFKLPSLRPCRCRGVRTDNTDITEELSFTVKPSLTDQLKMRNVPDQLFRALEMKKQESDPALTNNKKARRTRSPTLLHCSKSGRRKLTKISRIQNVGARQQRHQALTFHASKQKYTLSSGRFSGLQGEINRSFLCRNLTHLTSALRVVRRPLHFSADRSNHLVGIKCKAVFGAPVRRNPESRNTKDRTETELIPSRNV